MSEYGNADRQDVKTRDPLVRFLGGCAVVGAVILALLLGCAWFVGWQLTRDPTPGRARETFLTGDETRYWCVDLKADDAGLKTLFRKLDAVGEESRRKALHGTFLESMPLPHRRAHLEDLAPLTLEGSLFAAPGDWAARATFSRGILRMRAALKVMRWMMSRDPGKTETVSVDGIAVTSVRDNHVEFALANAGNRVLAAGNMSRMRAVLAAGAGPPHPELFALHREVELPGEDAWAFLSGAQLPGLPEPLSIAAAAASFDIDDADELLFRVAVSGRAAVPEGRAFLGTRDECVTVASSFLPMFDKETIEIDGDGAISKPPGSTVFTGRVRDLTKYLPEIPKRLGELVVRSTVGGRETPSATPSPEAPPSPGGPRSDTPAAPKREGIPNPPR